LPGKAQVSVLTSSDSPGEKKLARALKAELGTRMTSYAAQNGVAKKKFRQALSQNAETLVVSIGPEASRFAASSKAKNLVFCRVLDSQSAGLSGLSAQGVSVIPEPRQVIRTWKSLSPKSSTLGIITGPGLQQTMQDIARAAKSSNVKLVHRVAKSDKQFFYLAAKMASEVDAYWLLPDSRILSAVTIRRFMENSVKQGKQVIVYTPTLIKLGALMSAEPETVATAKTLNQVLISTYNGENSSPPRIHYVPGTNIQISSFAANRFGLRIPGSLKRYQYD